MRLLTIPCLALFCGLPALIACGGGSDEAERDLEVLAVEQDSPGAITLNQTHVFWLSESARGKVLSLAKTGGTPSEIASADSPHDIAVDDGFVYYGEADASLKRVAIMGGTPSSVTLQNVTDFALGASRVFGTSEETDELWSAPLQGGLLTFLNLQTLVLQPTGLVVDDTEVYWINRSTAQLSSLGLGGDAEATLVAAWTGTDTTELAANATHLFWADHETEQLLSVAKSGGTPVVLDDTQVHLLAANESHVYWSTKDSLELRRVPVEGGDSERLIRLDEAPGGLAIDGTHVYWSSPGAGTIQAVAQEQP